MGNSAVLNHNPGRTIRQFLENKQYSEAERCINDGILAGGMDLPFMYASLAEIRNAQEDFDAAEELAEKSLSLAQDNTEATFQLANACFGKNEIQRAESLFSRIDLEKNTDARFLAQLSRICLSRHDSAQALDHAARASGLNPRNPEYHVLTAEVLLAEKQPSKKSIRLAIEAAQKAIKLDRKDVGAWRMLIRATLKTGSQKEFKKVLLAARKALPGSPVPDTEVADFLVDNRRYQEAEEALLKTVRAAPDYALAYQVLGDLYIGTQQWAKAVDMAYKALGFSPYSLRTWKLAGTALVRNEEFNLAMGWLHKVLVADPEDVLVATMLAHVLHKLREFDAAYDLYQQLLTGTQDKPSILQSYGVLLIDMERNVEAIEALKRAHELDSENVIIQMNLATALTNAGEFDAARDIYRNLMAQSPEVSEAFLHYTAITKMDKDDRLATTIIDRIDDTVDDKHKENLNYSLAKIYEDQQDFDTSFRYLSRAGALHKRRLGYNEQANLNGFHLVKSIFSKEFIESLENCGSESRKPIFVLGMPRSGTTLVEQILSSHPKIIGGGELTFMNSVLHNHAAMTETRVVGSLSSLTCEQVLVLADDYLSRIAPIGPEDMYVVDKMPHNFMYIGLIGLMFPNARIIHMKRNPMATCLSCLKQRFTEGHEYSFDLQDLGRYYLAYLDLMSHWNEVLPGKIFHVQYETLTSDLEQQARKMIDYCGLEWNQACLDFHKNRRAVRTASLAQVRKPIYTDSVNFWRNYQEQLKPLSDILGADSTN